MANKELPESQRIVSKRVVAKKVFGAIVDKASSDNVFLLSSSVAFHCFLSFIPIISVIVGIYLILNFNLDWNHFEIAKELVPPEVYRLVASQAQRVNNNMNTVNVATVIAFMVSLWLSNNATRAFGQSLNVVFGKKSKTRLLYGIGASVVHTILIIFSVLFLSFTLGILPLIFASFNLPFEVRSLLIFLQWSIIFLYMIFSLCFAYKLLPDHGERIHWTRFLPGAFVATVFGSVLALLFSMYVASFGSYTRLYGALGVIVIFMLWLRLTFSCALFGGEINYFFLRDPGLARKFMFRRKRS